MKHPKCEACGRREVKSDRCGYCGAARKQDTVKVAAGKPSMVFKFKFVLDTRGGMV